MPGPELVPGLDCECQRPAVKAYSPFCSQMCQEMNQADDLLGPDSPLTKVPTFDGGGWGP